MEQQKRVGYGVPPFPFGEIMHHLHCIGVIVKLWRSKNVTLLTVLLIRRGNRDNLGIISHHTPFKHVATRH